MTVNLPPNPYSTTRIANIQVSGEIDVPGSISFQFDREAFRAAMSPMHSDEMPIIKVPNHTEIKLMRDEMRNGYNTLGKPLKTQDAVRGTRGIQLARKVTRSNDETTSEDERQVAEAKKRAKNEVKTNELSQRIDAVSAMLENDVLTPDAAINEIRRILHDQPSPHSENIGDSGSGRSGGNGSIYLGNAVVNANGHMYIPQNGVNRQDGPTPMYPNIFNAGGMQRAAHQIAHNGRMNSEQIANLMNGVRDNYQQAQQRERDNQLHRRIIRKLKGWWYRYLKPAPRKPKTKPIKASKRAPQSFKVTGRSH